MGWFEFVTDKYIYIHVSIFNTHFLPSSGSRGSKNDTPFKVFNHNAKIKKIAAAISFHCFVSSVRNSCIFAKPNMVNGWRMLFCQFDPHRGPLVDQLSQ